MTRPAVACISRTLRLVVADDGQCVPMVELYDARGEDTDDMEEAVCATAGPLRGDLWFDVTFADYVPTPTC